MPATRFIVARGLEQMHRHRIEQFVGKVDAAKWLHLVEGRHPLRLAGKLAQHALLALPQDRKRLDDPIAQDRKKLRPRRAQRFQDIAREFAVMRALFDNHEIVRPIERFPDFRELPGKQFAEQRPHAHARKIIAPPPDRAPARAVVAMLRMIERLLHEPGEGNRAFPANLVANEEDERFVGHFDRSRVEAMES